MKPAIHRACRPAPTAPPNLCRADCTVCGDGIIQAPETCDDGNSNECDPVHPQKPFPGDSCNNECGGLFCKDP